MPFDFESLTSRSTAATHRLEPPEEEKLDQTSPRNVLRQVQNHLTIPTSKHDDPRSSLSSSAISDDDSSSSAFNSVPCSTPALSESPSSLELSSTSDAADVQSGTAWVEVPHEAVSWVLFSHLTYCFPEKQRYPHRTNQEEIEYLNQFFGQEGVPQQSVDFFSLHTSPEREFFVYVYNNEQKDELLASEEPLIISELMMLGIDEHCIDVFAGKGSGYNACAGTTENASVQQVMRPKNVGEANRNALDQFWFNPCGYSCNALMENSMYSSDGSAKQSIAKPFGPHFATAHISPEPASSYASLEATFPFDFDSNTRSKFQLSPLNALTTFSPRCVHVVEVELCGKKNGNNFLGGQRQLKSEKSNYDLVAVKEFRGAWFHIRHAEYAQTF